MYIKKVLVVLLIIVSSNIYAILDIEITQGVDTAVPIGIYQFEVINKNNNIDFSVLNKVISADLYRSGLFNSLEFNNNLIVKNDRLLSVDDIKEINRLQKEHNIEYLIQGDVSINPYDRFQVGFRLVDVYNLNKSVKSTEINQVNQINKLNINSAILLNQSFNNIEKNNLRSLGHHISDLIFEKLTGVKGVFSSKIVYVNVTSKNKKREYVLEIADSDGYNPHPLVVSSEPIMSPTWHPNGKQIAYVSFAGFRSKINVVELATGKTKTISSFKGINGAPSWSPDGTKLALVLSHENIPKIYMLNLQNNRLTKITTGPSIDTEPRWAPNGKSFIFTSNRSGGPQIYSYKFDSEKIEKLTYDGSYNARGSYTPDGKKLIMIHRSEDKSFNIAVLDLTSYNLDVLTSTNNFVMDESPSISANGQQIIYATKEGNKGILAEVSIDGRVKLKRPAREGDVQEPAWSPYMG